MSSNNIAVVPTSATHVSLYDMGSNGRLIRTVQITSGQIIGSPLITGGFCMISSIEKGGTCIRKYRMPQFILVNAFYR